MNVELPRTMTVTEFLDSAEARPEQPRAELINGQVVLVVSERVVHNRLKGAGGRIFCPAARAGRVGPRRRGVH